MKTLYIASFSNDTENWCGCVPMTENGELCDAIYNAADDLYSDNDIDNCAYHRLTETICNDMTVYDSSSCVINGYLFVYFTCED